jgi:hypothetical protein
MKRVNVFLLGAIALMCFSRVNGQTAVGLKAGVNIANLSGDSHDPRIGLHGGLFVNRSISKKISIQPELLFSGEGVKYVWAGVEHRWKLNYIQVPVMLQYYPVSKIYVEAGPQVGFLISAKDKLGEDSHANMKENINSVQFAIGAGLGIKVTNMITLYGRYNFGLSDITSTFYDAADLHSNVGQIGIAARFHK